MNIYPLAHRLVVKMDGVEYTILKQNDILAVVE